MKGYCEKCRDTNDFNVKMVDKEKTIKGRLIKYVGKVAYCSECREEVFSPEIRDYNLRELDTAYRDAEKLIRVEEIESILEKYDIGKRPLSLLLEWGEGTLSRYVDGDTPSKAYSDILKQIYKNKEYYRKLLEQNRDKITPVAFRKSLAAIEKMTDTTTEELSKIESAVKYLLMQTSEITPLALQKLLYFAQGFQKAFTDTYLFEEDCEAWVHGPVFRDVYEKYKSYGFSPIEEKEIRYENIQLTEEEKELLDHVVSCFGCYSGKVLEHMTHSEEPWRLARRGLNDLENSDRIIEKEEIASYFISVREKYKMLNLIDIKDYSKDLFEKLYS